MHKRKFFNPVRATFTLKANLEKHNDVEAGVKRAQKDFKKAKRHPRDLIAAIRRDRKRFGSMYINAYVNELHKLSL